VRRRLALVLVVVLALAVGTAVARSRGYGVGGRTVVRCRRGHLFTTWWIPGVSVKAVRLGWYRFQRCPVGPHWSLVVPVRAADLSPEELALAAGRQDTAVP
jgi:hypothetical protein